MIKSSVFTFIFLVLAAVMIAVNLTRPPLPIDETRYLTVAWEYLVRDQWILPTLNFEPYHHKPPFLFWTINALWQFFGMAEIWIARLIPFCAALATLWLTHKIAQLLWPEEKDKADIAVLMMAGTPFFLIYSTLIMFDTLLAVAVLTGIYALLKQHQGENKRFYTLVLALAFAFGGMIKGPVILLHLLPVAFLAPLFVKNSGTSSLHWFGSIGIAVLIGFFLVLGWALPAAKLGGPEYEQMIFWGQSAGRMVRSFDHARPFWFYLIALPVMLLPWIFIPVTRTIRPSFRWAMIFPTSHQGRFLVCWTLPVFLVFMIISGKQVHYLIPVLPGIFLLMAHLIVKYNLLARLSVMRLYFLGIAPIATILTLLIVASLYARVTDDSFNSPVLTQIASLHIHWILIALAVFVLIRRYGLMQDISRISALRFIVLAQMAGVIGLHFALSPVMATYYDLRPVAGRIAVLSAEGRPLAVARAWHGEVGYLARLKQSVAVIPAEDIGTWLDTHPKGIVLLRHDQGDLPSGVSLLYTQPYRSPTKAISILGK